MLDQGPLPAFIDGLLDFGGLLAVRSAGDGRYLLVNAAFSELLGRPESEIVGRTVRELFPPDTADEILRGDADVIRGAVTRTRPQMLQDVGGGTWHYLVHKFPVLDPDGVPFAVGSIAMDVSSIEDEVEVSRAARVETETRFRAVFDHAPIGQLLAEVGGGVTSVNAPMAAMLGYEPEEMLGFPVAHFTPPAEFDRIRIAADGMLSGESSSASAVWRFRHRDGHEVPVRVTMALLRDHLGVPRWWVGMVIDISGEERARVELDKAHEAALISARRLRLMHNIATAANEATAIGTLAPRVLAMVCDHFGWTSGALLRWDDDTPTVVAERGRAASRLAAQLPAPQSEAVAVVGRVVVVPLPTRGRSALVFPATTTGLDENQCEVLGLVASETARVIEREAAAKRLRDSERRFRSVFDGSPLPMALSLGESGTFGAVNNALCELLGRPRAELTGMSARDVVHPDDIELTDRAGAAAMAAPDGRHRAEMRFLHSSGAVVTTLVTLAWMDAPDDQKHLLAQIEDITARRTVEEVLRRQAEQDALTGLANRTLLGRMLYEMGSAAKPCAILFIDLDGFKLINDTRGHDVGDEVLLEVAARLRAAVRPSDVVARFGGDEFVVVCSAGVQGDEVSVARRVADRVEQALRRPIATQSGPAAVTASIGIASGCIDADQPYELLQRADAAMYQAKRLGKDRREVYDNHLHERALEHQRTEAALRTALADERFTVHYQPIIDLTDSTIVGFEALVRLIDEEGHLVGPDKFIGVAEQSGLIVPMGAWVLEESCRTIAWLRAQTGRPYTVSVNIAARQAARSDLAETVQAALRTSGLPESALTLELTESALLEADEATLAQLMRLRDSGVVIGLDDFGTGYSSLTYLRRFPVTHLKVDRSFVAGMDRDASDRAIVRAVTGLAAELGLNWIAEGVETVEQRDLLSALGEGHAQGYLFARPVPRSDLLQIVTPLDQTA